MAQNPYERRGRRPQVDVAAGMDWAPLGRPQIEIRPAIGMEDLDAMVRSAAHRAEGRVAAKLSADHDVALANACRDAWYEGRDAGRPEGRLELLRVIDDQHGAFVRAMIRGLGELAEVELADGADAVAAHRQLREALRDAVRGFERLVAAHHDEFR